MLRSGIGRRPPPRRRTVRPGQSRRYKRPPRGWRFDKDRYGPLLQSHLLRLEATSSLREAQLVLEEIQQWDSTTLVKSSILLKNLTPHSQKDSALLTPVGVGSLYFDSRGASLPAQARPSPPRLHHNTEVLATLAQYSDHCNLEEASS